MQTISANSFQVTVPQLQPQKNKDVIEQIEKLVIAVETLKEESNLKSEQIAVLEEKVALYRRIEELSNSQIATYKQVADNQAETFKILNEKISNLEKAIVELKEINVKLEKKVATEKRIGNLKGLVGILLSLGFKFL